ncbi:unnamed protein product [Cuscuta europaea]|uniref:Uncharacterized protein n=1 Tax=Cuscuta europaea TaxID=41803 RepID=A0A9P1DWG0_CUSEU|nr:unnamed protein product [Cuscuta europaea]
MNLQFQPSKSKFEMCPLSNGKYDHLKQRETTAQWIMISEQPFNVAENDGFSFTCSRLISHGLKRSLVLKYEVMLSLFMRLKKGSCCLLLLLTPSVPIITSNFPFSSVPIKTSTFPFW